MLFLYGLFCSNTVERNAASFRGVIVSRSLLKAQNFSSVSETNPLLEQLGMCCWLYDMIPYMVSLVPSLQR